MSTRPVPVPESCSALYVVLTPEPLDPEGSLDLPTESDLRRNGTSEAAIARFRVCEHQHLLICEGPAAEFAEVLLDARIKALQLAELNDGIVVDVLPPRVLEHSSESVSLDHAAQWFVFDYDRIDEGLLTTEGLDRFGLPELEARGVPSESHAMYAATLTGLAHRLIAEWPTNDPVGLATVTLRDIAYGLGDAQAAQTPRDRTLDVQIDYDAEARVLHVTVLGDPATTLFAS